MSHTEFPRYLIVELDKTMRAIDEVSNHISILTGQARDLCALAKRYVSEGEMRDLAMERVGEVEREVGSVINREREAQAQRDVEMRERVIEEGGRFHGLIVGGAVTHAEIEDIAKAGSPKSTVHIFPSTVPRDGSDFDVTQEEISIDGARYHEQNPSASPAEGEWYRGCKMTGQPCYCGDGPCNQVEFYDSPAVENASDDAAAGEDASSLSATEPAAVEAPVVDEPAFTEQDEAALRAELAVPSAEEKPLVEPDRGLREREEAREEDAVQQHRNMREAAAFYEQVMTLWTTTLLTEAQIGKRLECTKALVTTMLEQARMDGDPRMGAKRGVAPKMTLSDKAREIMDRPAAKNHMALPRSGVELGEFEPPKPGDGEATRISTGVCVVNPHNNKIYGNLGIWTASAEQAQTVIMLNGGQMFGHKLIAERCGWDSVKHLERAITPMIERLRDIGVEMTNTPVGLVIRKA